MTRFAWAVSGVGYSWENVSRDERYRIGLATFAKDTAVQTYQPMVDTPLLFHKFAELDGPDDYIAFANKYGQLTTGVTVLDDDGEVLESCTLADQLRWPNGRLQEPHDLVRTGNDETEAEPEVEAIWLFHSSNMRSWNKIWDGGSAKGRALERCREVILANLNFNVLPIFNDQGAISFRPTNLLSALWLQFGIAVGGGFEHRQCPQCGDWFAVGTRSPDAERRTRRDKVFCTERCRTERHYEQKSKRNDRKRVTKGSEKSPRGKP
ncbi:hypothetical protein [Limnoglobus roseus]|uniref:Uncharacterized protein n=1 Tax=Limnoglobus roseus TaxID=2598579 RepID=A0A5C1AGN4_9BACT|nr:hypothetical protein [Limnoglobus roseus]QEL17403.1 hypothetical protein PX52LOC_04391 [Limnoglobus roseus]